MEEELDLTKSSWVSENEIYISAIKESIEENYPEINIIEELKEIDFTLEDLIDSKKAEYFIGRLEKKYPSDD
jgi:hypothetical protein